MAQKDGQEAALVAAEDEEEVLPESEETALALNVEELRFWVKQVHFTVLILLSGTLLIYC